jgi:adenylate kinase family enzyme
VKRILIIGSSGAGKTTRARELSAELGIKAFHLDRFFWEADWGKKKYDERLDIVENIVLRKEWIIEGSYLFSSKPALEAADTIIFLHCCPLLCLLRVIKRHQAHPQFARRDIPSGSMDKLTLSHMFNILMFPQRGKKILERNLERYMGKVKPETSGKMIQELLHIIASFCHSTFHLVLPIRFGAATSAYSAVRAKKLAQQIRGLYRTMREA